MRNPDYTKALIKEKLSDGDTEIATTSCKVSLACPLGKMRMKIPARAATCDHLQCFDADMYIRYNSTVPYLKMQHTGLLTKIRTSLYKTPP